MGVTIRRFAGMSAAVALTLGGLGAFVFPPLFTHCTLQGIPPRQMILEIDIGPRPAAPVLLQPRLVHGAWRTSAGSERAE